MELKGKRITILGAGESGLQSALFCHRRDARVFVSELKRTERLSQSAEQLQAARIAYEFGRHTWSKIQDSELIIISPGIPPHSTVYQRVMQLGIPVWSEVELASRYTDRELIGVTGTNGKTTVTTLIRNVLLAAGKSAISCGNIGNSFIREAEKATPETIVVLELSSFQLAHIDRLKPHVAILLNLSSNHFDWHGSFQRYREAKWRIFKNQTSSDYALINRLDRDTRDHADQIKAEIVLFDGAHSENPNHDAVRRVSELYKVSSQLTEEVLRNFKGLEHRLEEVATYAGVRYINDSKSTTVASLGWALNIVQGDVVLVVGGRSKGGDFRTLRSLVRRKVKFLIAIGESQEKIVSSFEGCAPIYCAAKLSEAIRIARGAARAGQTVLFSPACASFDMFEDYQDRGRQFKTIVRNWQKEPIAAEVL